MNTKKNLTLMLLIITLCIVFASCKSRDACPGVSKVHSEILQIV